MAKLKETFNEKEKEKKPQKQNQDKKERMEDRKTNAVKGRLLNYMLAYVDEEGNLSATPPDPRKKRVFDAAEIEIGVPASTASDKDPTQEGRVDYFNQSKGFGFIVDNRGNKLFFHVNQLAAPVCEQDIVSFEVERGPRGLAAVGVQKRNIRYTISLLSSPALKPKHHPILWLKTNL